MNKINSTIHSMGRPALATLALLLFPLIAMQFTSEVNWTSGDFLIAGMVLFGAGMAYTLIIRKSDLTMYKAAMGLALVSGLLLLWVNGAVGLIRSENNSFNGVYVGVLAVGAAGTLWSRFEAKGMAYTMVAMVAAQAVVALIALQRGMHHASDSSVWEILGVNAFFMALFALSALLFLRLARRNGKASNEARENVSAGS